MSPITSVCFYTTDAFRVYTTFFLGIILCGTPILIMMTFGILAYQNIKKTTALARLRVDRQLTIIVFIQVLLTLIGLSPYGIYNAYALITIDVEKDADQKAKDALASNITFLFGSVAYAGRFYLLMFASPRFRHTVKNQVLRWRQPRRIIPSAR
ncbi:unnamed protein product [Rotaria sp. Silwood1]|nr:unnamed protein product [Rotaria sp. Silwood1]CAF0971401.1 unnamed protein product [Rotaria sp. Silwood1]CAF0980631.1 unnamed protein product [Rotaria sp. Silwood1]CAF3393238.1 unnamed protein product [Rotaria sp. Silwood1]CAF3407187.1 unnamed protein product [Rotaria sp. Silwood1]